MFADLRVLVTGGTGSLGRRLIRRILAGESGRPERLTVFSRDEAKQHQMRLGFEIRAGRGEAAAGDRLRFRLGDVADYDSLLPAVREADVVLHVAALKQVPTCEYFPAQAVRTNVLGTENLIRAVADPASRVHTVLGVSTDKACKPVNVMGMTKAIQERLLVEANLEAPRTRFLAVRYGNVLASRGSVVPLFQRQIRAGGPVTVTVPEMTRFLLPLSRAVETVFAAIAEGRPGEIWVPDQPAARVIDVARALIDGRPIAIQVTGIRPGEKLHEILVSEEEIPRSERRGAYLVIRPSLPELLRGPQGAFAPLAEAALAAEYSSRDAPLALPALRALFAEHGLLADPGADDEAGVG
jgi:UDP-glucose 4-epimerase